jgi:hypothetical protein
MQISIYSYDTTSKLTSNCPLSDEKDRDETDIHSKAGEELKKIVRHSMDPINLCYYWKKIVTYNRSGVCSIIYNFLNLRMDLEECNDL